MALAVYIRGFLVVALAVYIRGFLVVALATHPPSSAEVKERIELYLYSTSGLSWPVTG